MITSIWVDESLLLKSLLLLLCQGDVVESMAERRLTTTLTRGERSLSQGGGCLSHNAGSTVSTSESLRVTVLRPRSGDTGGGVQGYGHQSSPPWHHLNTERVRHTHIASNSLIPRTHISSPELQFSFFQLLTNHISSVVLTLFSPQYYIVFSGKRLQILGLWLMNIFKVVIWVSPLFRVSYSHLLHYE